MLLALLYAVSVVAHYAALRSQTRFPLLSTDEAQYATLGENLHLGHGFTVRGEFHAGLPPLYPLFVALADSFGPVQRISVLFLSCLTISLALFPAYKLARYIDLGPGTACALAAAAVALPNTVYAGLYMTETLSYPLFLTTFWLCARWLERPSVSRGLAAGTLLAAMMLTKLAALSFAAAVLATVVILSLAPQDEKRRFARPGRSALWMLGVGVVTQAAWQAFKLAHHAGGLGMYGHSLEDSGLHHLSARLLGAYLGDFLLAPGLLAAVPLLLWFRENYRPRFALAVLLGTTLAFEIAIHAVLETGLTGYVSERLYMYSLPLVAIFAAKGLEALSGATRLVKLLFVAVPLALLGLLALYSFPYIPVLDIPWASALGSSRWAAVDHFTKERLFVLAAALIVAAGASILLVSPRRRAPVFAGFVLLLNSVAIASSAKKMDTLTAQAAPIASGVVGWLNHQGVNAGDRLIVCAQMAFYQERHWVTPMDAFFIEWHQRFDLTQFKVFDLEALGRFDVRIASSPEQVRELMRPGDRLLTATRISGLAPLSYQYPYYLYTLRGATLEKIEPLYTFDITGNLAIPQPPDVAPAQQTRILLGPPVNLPAGHYEVEFRVRARPADHIAAEVVQEPGGTAIARREGSAGELGPLEFSTHAYAPVRFLLTGPDAGKVGFQGAVVRFAGALKEPMPDRPSAGVVTSHTSARLGPKFYPLCGPLSLNGVEQAPSFTTLHRDPLDILVWTPLDQARGTASIEFISKAHGDFWLPAARWQQNQFKMVAFRAAAGSGSLPADGYRVRLVRIEQGGRATACSEFWNLTVADDPAALNP